MEIKSRFIGKVLFKSKKKSMKETVIEAVKKKINLRGVDLTGVDLTGVDLTGVDLTGVDLTGIKITEKEKEQIYNNEVFGK